MVKKTVTTTEEVDGTEGAPETLDDDVIRALTDLEGADEVAWQIHRISEPNSGYCGEMSSAELSHRSISLTYGPGLYRVKGIRPDGKYFKSGRIKVSVTMQKAAESSLADTLTAKLSGAGGDSNALLLAMINSNAQIVSAALTRPPEQKAEIPWAAIVAAIPPSLVALKEFFQNKADPMKQMMDAINLTEKLRGEKEGPSSWQDLLRDGVKSIPSVLQSLKGGNGTAVSATPQPAQVRVIPETPEAIPSPTASESEDMNLRLIHWLRASLEKLITAAMRNGNTELYAELLVEELPGELPESDVLTLLSRSDWFDMLCVFDSRVQPYRGWFEQLREDVFLVLQPDGEVTHVESRNRARADTGTTGEDPGNS